MGGVQRGRSSWSLPASIRGDRCFFRGEGKEKERENDSIGAHRKKCTTNRVGGGGGGGMRPPISRIQARSSSYSSKRKRRGKNVPDLVEIPKEKGRMGSPDVVVIDYAPSGTGKKKKGQRKEF